MKHLGLEFLIIFNNLFSLKAIGLFTFLFLWMLTLVNYAFSRNLSTSFKVFPKK